MATAHQLYPIRRLAGMGDTDLTQVLRFALADAAETSDTVYDGMDRADTVATARRTVKDVADQINLRAAFAVNRQVALDVLHAEASKLYLAARGTARVHASR